MSSLWVSALSLLLAIVPAAIYASVINDVTDLAADLEAGKRNGVAGRSRSMVATFAWLWRDDALLLSCYLATWLAFSLYSLPPFRFKERGAAGVLCDAAGEQLFPALVAVFLACRGAQRAVSGAWVASVAVWALAYGLRGIVWHQLTDVDNDRAAGFRTFARRHPRAAPVIGTYVVFPLELGAMAAGFSRAVRALRRSQCAPLANGAGDRGAEAAVLHRPAPVLFRSVSRCAAHHGVRSRPAGPHRSGRPSPAVSAARDSRDPAAQGFDREDRRQRLGTPPRRRRLKLIR